MPRPHKHSSTVVAVRLDDELTGRIDAILSARRRRYPGASMTRSDVIRDCLLLGLPERERLELDSSTQS